MPPTLTRRTLLASIAAAGAASALRALPAGERSKILTRAIPSSGEALPLVGLGSWITFNVGADPKARDGCAAVIAAFLAAGGRLIDSSPMYGSSQEVIGHGLAKLGAAGKALFSADKVWTSSAAEGPEQIEASRAAWGVVRFDLLQVHNLLAWERHLATLAAMKAAGHLRYVGITTSHGRRHDEVERIVRSQPLDFVQLTYNLRDRDAEQRLLPLLRERGVAVIANRPLDGGDLVRRVERHPLPAWAAEFDCGNWPQFLLRFVVSHPAITCAIPATSSVEHVQEDMGASYGRLPDEAMRQRMIRHVESL